MNELNLSDKLQVFEGWHNKENRFIHISHIKEFVKELKECPTGTYWTDWVNKLAGDKLNDNIDNKSEPTTEQEIKKELDKDYE